MKIKADGKGYGKPCNPHGEYRPCSEYMENWEQFDRDNPTLPIYLPNGEPYLKDDVVEGEMSILVKFRRLERWRLIIFPETRESLLADGRIIKDCYRVHPVVTEQAEQPKDDIQTVDEFDGMERMERFDEFNSGLENVKHALTWWTPLVIPLSQLTKEDWQQVFEAGFGTLANASFEITRYSGQTRLKFLASGTEVYYEFYRQQFYTGILDFNQLAAFEKLYSLHADLHGLIEKGLALNKLDYEKSI